MITIDSGLTRAQAASSLRAKFFRGLADPSRLAILQSLRSSPLTVGEIVETTGMGQSNVSNHLSCLLDCCLVEKVRQGRYSIYSLSDQRVAQLLTVTDEILADRSEHIAACIRYETPERTDDGS